HVEYLHPDRVYERVLTGTADLGLVSFPRRTAKLDTWPWSDEDMVVVCSPRHPLAQNVAVPIAHLEGQKFVHFDRNLEIRKQVDRFLREHDVSVEVAAEFDNIENIKQAVGVGAGIALLPQPTLRREVRARTLVALPLYNCKLTRPLGIIHRRRQRLSAAARCFLDLLLQNGQGGNGDGKAAAHNHHPHKDGNHRGPKTGLSKRTVES